VMRWVGLVFTSMLQDFVISASCSASIVPFVSKQSCLTCPSGIWLSSSLLPLHTMVAILYPAHLYHSSPPLPLYTVVSS